MLLLPILTLWELCAASQLDANHDQRPLGNEDTPASDTSPGIGFDLSFTYATVALKYPNKTVVDVAKLDGDEQYIQLMQRLSDQAYPQIPTSPPWLAVGVPDLWLAQEIQQSVRRQLSGLPSLSDLTLLSNFFQQLYDLAVASSPETLPKSVLVSRPLLLNLEPQDIDTALKSIGLESIKHSPYPRIKYEPENGISVTQSAAVWAGLGLDNCSKCEDENRPMRVEQILFLTYTKTTFCVDILWTETVGNVGKFSFYTPFAECMNIAHRNGTVMENIKRRIIKSVYGFVEFNDDPMGNKIGAKGIGGVLMNGESGMEPVFLSTVYAAVKEIGRTDLYGEAGVDYFEMESNGEGGFEEMGKMREDVTFMAARGAAELALRWEF